MALSDAFAAHEALHRDQVLSATFGHLAPEPGQVYHGSVVFACGAYGGDIAYLSIDFKTGDGTPLNDNPWSFQDLTGHICQWACDQANGYRGRKPISEPIETDGKVFAFNGTYTRFKNNNCRITGTFRQLAVAK